MVEETVKATETAPPETTEIVEVQLNDNFYRDGFAKLMLCFCGLLIALAILIAISLYLHFTKPIPTTFYVDREWRVRPAVPVDQPYLSEPDMLQWVGENLPKTFNFDFVNYNDQLKAAQQYFTPNGWTVFVNQLNNYVNYNDVTKNRLFVNGVAGGAPYIINQNVLQGRYAWWVQMPVIIKYASYNPTTTSRILTLQVLVVRISTLNNLNGIGIENVIVTNSTGG